MYSKVTCTGTTWFGCGGVTVGIHGHGLLGVYDGMIGLLVYEHGLLGVCVYLHS